MFKTAIAATAVAIAFALPAAAVTLTDYIPSALNTGKSVYVLNDGAVELTFYGADAGNTNIAYFVKSGDDQPLFTNKLSVFGDTATLDGMFKAGDEIVFSLTSIGGSVTSFITGSEYARAGFTNYGFAVAFEDTLFNLGSDKDYNDLVFGVSNVTNQVPAVPVPAALPLIASAFGGLAMLRRRKRT